MVNRRISNDLKECALHLWDHGWDIEDICKELGVSKSSCYRWRKTFEELGTVNQPPSPLVGRPRKITRAMLGAIKDLYRQDPDLSLGEIRDYLAAERDLEVSTSTLSRNLIDAGLTREMLQKFASERDEAQREEFKQMLQTYFLGNGSEFVLVDETSKNDESHGQGAPTQDFFIHGIRYALCAVLTVDGYFSAEVVEGSRDAKAFYDFIVKDVLPHMKPYPQERSVLVLDNRRIDHNADLIDLVEGAGCIVLSLPPSLDLTPTEASFSALEAYIQCHGHELVSHDNDPVGLLFEATGCITGEKVQGWFRNAGYITE